MHALGREHLISVGRLYPFRRALFPEHQVATVRHRRQIGRLPLLPRMLWTLHTLLVTAPQAQSPARIGH